MNKKIVIALGGNALGYTNEEEVNNVKKVAKIIVDLKQEGYNIVVTHGNGPQVGKINKAMESIDDTIPFAECGAMSEGYIGYHLMQAINNELTSRNINTECSTILTQVLVDKQDKAFKNPTKPIGKYLTKTEADKLAKETNYIFKEDSGKGYRRVVSSPKPIEIIEKDAIKQMVDKGQIVIACGGGGVPVIKRYNKLVGIDAVIDKDLSSSLLAREIEADKFLILTNIEKVCINYKQENEEQIDSLTTIEAENYIKTNQFAEGSMLPKIKSCLEFVNYTNKSAIITSLEKAKQGVLGKTGTVICSEKKEVKKMAVKKDNRIETNSHKLRAVALVLAIVLGGLGAHRFYVNKKISGVIWLLTGGLLGVGVLIDILLILFGKFSDSLDRNLKYWTVTGAKVDNFDLDQAKKYYLEQKQKINKTVKRKNFEFGLTAFSIILILIILLGLSTHFLPTAQFIGDQLIPGSGVVKATLANILMSPIEGFADAIDVCIFVFVLGGFLKIVQETGALDTGVKVLVQKLGGHELLLIPILMIIFSIGGTTYGMLEETVGFYALLAATMVAAGMDTIVASATILLGAGVGVLGSTVNPFAPGVAISAAKTAGLTVNSGTIILIGMLLWLVSLAIAIGFVMSYAIKVKKDKGSTFLSLREQKVQEKRWGKHHTEKEAKLTEKQKLTLVLFGLAFLIMIFGFIPWGEFINTKWLSFSSVLTGAPLGDWWFFDAALWFLLIGIAIGIINGMKEKELVNNIISGCADMMAVILIIAVARGASYLMGVTHLDNYIVYNAAELLKNMPEVLFTPLNYILHIFLSVLVPSSSGLGTLSTPIMAPIASQLGYSVETTIMTFVAANGLVNLITPTCGAIMGGLAIAGVEYSTWVKWSLKVIGCIALASLAILMLAMIIF